MPWHRAMPALDHLSQHAPLSRLSVARLAGGAGVTAQFCVPVTVIIKHCTGNTMASTELHALARTFLLVPDFDRQHAAHIEANVLFSNQISPRYCASLAAAAAAAEVRVFAQPPNPNLKSVLQQTASVNRQSKKPRSRHPQRRWKRGGCRATNPVLLAHARAVAPGRTRQARSPRQPPPPGHSRILQHAQPQRRP